MHCWPKPQQNPLQANQTPQLDRQRPELPSCRAMQVTLSAPVKPVQQTFWWKMCKYKCMPRIYECRTYDIILLQYDI